MCFNNKNLLELKMMVLDILVVYVYEATEVQYLLKLTKV